MRYEHTAHYREDAIAEVDAALAAGNSPDSVEQTLKNRYFTEHGRSQQDAPELLRVLDQLRYVGQFTGQVAVNEAVA